MKRVLAILSVVLFSVASGAYAQVEETKTETAPVQDAAMPAPVAAKPQAPATKSVPVKSADTIKGNAGKDVALIVAKGECASCLKPIGVINKHPNWTMKVAVDVQVVFMGRMSRKTVMIEHLAAGETHFIGCGGCVANQTGETCTTYKILAAQYKPN